jgi:hypothetical protein
MKNSNDRRYQVCTQFYLRNINGRCPPGDYVETDSNTTLDLKGAVCVCVCVCVDWILIVQDIRSGSVVNAAGT